ncbi:uncharacterized protein PHALS_01159 [Plasmopara halstedii]|uniref:Uncharacterized protein n=1 Tax=Plasmopara halstedii TaxID=4781 RepID=A0A0P1ASV7_PLAHL|nr:uncharacterized protein PHALS_01159 [Plasmopara halstedii]CEG44825.1 hypothetical protein PHALS_01159 [Plasmopara halstedii]|eukprot:XP_024581194.1 hypothetical protein PHALS_01159 [Plasmopara halstedii]
MSSTMHTNTPSSWQKRAGRQKQQANSRLGSWFVSKFTSKNKMLREHDEETAQNLRRRPVGKLSAVTNQQQANAARRDELSRPKPMRQKSFLRQQLQEMKRQSAEALLRAQKRMDGEIAAVSEEDDLDSKSSYYNEEEVQVVDDSEDALRESLRSNPASSRRSSTCSRRRSAAEEKQERDDEMLAHETQRHEYSEEVNRRMSQATQLYAEAINALDFALHPKRQPEIEPSSRPLLLGVKQGNANMPRSEWV